MMKDWIFYLEVENQALRGKIGQIDEKLFSEFQDRIKLSYDD
jgi:hypothetical protein